MTKITYHYFADEDTAREYAATYWDSPDYFAFLTETDKGWQVIVKYYPEEL